LKQKTRSFLDVQNGKTVVGNVGNSAENQAFSFSKIVFFSPQKNIFKKMQVFCENILQKQILYLILRSEIYRLYEGGLVLFV
jgi:hypothetical protein